MGPKGYPASKILVVKTTEGWVWCSRLSVCLEASDRQKLGLFDEEIGAEFLWPWYAAKACHAYEGVAEAVRLDSIYRELAQYEPTRTILSTHMLNPQIIPDAQLVPFEQLNAGQRVFASSIAPLKSWATPRCAEDDYNSRVISHIHTRQSALAIRHPPDMTQSQIVFDRAPKRIRVNQVDLSPNSKLVKRAAETISNRQVLSLRTLPYHEEMDVGLTLVSSGEYQSHDDEQGLPIDVFSELPEEIGNLVVGHAVQAAWDESNAFEAISNVCSMRLASRKLMESVDNHLFDIFKCFLSDEHYLAPTLRHRIAAHHIKVVIGAQKASSLFNDKLSTQPSLRCEQIKKMLEFLQSRTGLARSKALRERPTQRVRDICAFLQKKPFSTPRSLIPQRDRWLDKNTIEIVLDEDDTSESNAFAFTLQNDRIVQAKMSQTPMPTDADFYVC